MKNKTCVEAMAERRSFLGETENGRMETDRAVRAPKEAEAEKEKEKQPGAEAGEEQEKDKEGKLDLREVEAWGEPVDGAKLLDELDGLVSRFVILPKWAAEALSLWVLHTYAFELREVSTYLGIESPEKRCGKTTLLSVLSELVNRPVVAANISPPAFFRVIQQTRPTLLIDEADTFLQSNDELRGILISGYTKKTAFVVRVTNQHSEDGYRKFSCWCPKVVAAIGRLPDTLADRCILIRMQRKTSVEQCERFGALDTTELRRKCARFVRDNAEAIRKAKPKSPAGMNDRAVDIWEPLLALAELVGGEWPARARQAAEGLTIGAQESNPIASLLLDLFYLFVRSKAEKIFTRELVESLNRRMDRPWAEARKGKPITDIWLAQQLRPYGVRPTNVWINGEQAKGFLMKDLKEVFIRYIAVGIWAATYPE